MTYYRYEHGGGVQRGGTGVSPGHHGGDAVRRSAAPLARWCRRVRPRHRPRRTDHSQHRCPRSAAPSQLRRAQGTRRTVRHPSILTLAAQCALIAKFHYTDPTRTGPDTDKVRAHCRVRVVEFNSYSTTCADFVRVRSVSGPCRVRVVEFSFKCLCTYGEVTSPSLWSQYDRHFVGITRHNALR